MVTLGLPWAGCRPADLACAAQGLAQYGNGFLAKFEAASCPNRLLEEISLVDTPGVLSGEKQRIERTYNFIDVCGWFAARCDLILLLFDPHKLDVRRPLTRTHLPDVMRACQKGQNVSVGLPHGLVTPVQRSQQCLAGKGIYAWSVEAKQVMQCMLGRESGM